jgi:hypothetical protein
MYAVNRGLSSRSRAAVPGNMFRFAVRPGAYLIAD